MRRERLFLTGIVECADHIADFLQDCDRARFDSSDLIRSAVVFKLTVIGEAASKVTRARLEHPSIPWQRIIGFRNVMVHDYFGTDWDIVWQAATVYAPQLRQQIAAILAELPPL